MELPIILLRTVLMYAFVFVMLRLMGKREIGKLSVFDLVISIMIAEIAVLAIESPERPIWEALGPIALLVLIQIGFAYLLLKNRWLRLLADGKPSVMIRDGQLNRSEMARMRYNLDDLMAQLRENRVDNISQVELAVLEETGKLSVIPKARPAQEAPSREAAPAQAAAAEAERPAPPETPKVRYELLPLPLIMDGKVQDDNLEKIGKNRFWLKNELKQHGVSRFKDVFLCSVDHKGKLYVDRKDD